MDFLSFYQGKFLNYGKERVIHGKKEIFVSDFCNEKAKVGCVSFECVFTSRRNR